MYSKIAPSYDELYSEEQRNKLSIIKENLNVKGLILDIGSGTGLSKSFFNKIILLEPEINLIKHSNGKGVCGIAENLPFKDNSFDCIICITAIHHFHLNKAIDEIKRISKKDTKYAFTIMKKSKDFYGIIKELHKNFSLKEIEEVKDLILVSN